MIRTAAALFARKTAIVAVTGVVVIGGAGLALADVVSDDETPEVIDSTAEADTTAGDATEGETTEGETTEGETTEGETTEGDTADPAATNSPTEDGGDDAALETELVTEHPENHGKYVSEAAKGGGECAGLTGRDKGQCVSGVARSTAGKPGAEEPVTEQPVTAQPATEQPATEQPEVEQPDVEQPKVEQPEVEEPANTRTAPAADSPKGGKPAHAGGPKK